MTHPDTLQIPRAVVEQALRRAYQLGQTYWQQADSESYKEQNTQRAIAMAVIQGAKK